MGLNYHSRHKNDSESFWTSYSDLFLGLSSIFLLLYVVASLRTGTDGIKHSTENKKLKVEIQDLRNQLATYESVKENYIQNQASKNEVNEYNELMDKLTLLKEEAKNEKNNLRQSALENEEKEKALNKYQQMVRNVINANSLSKVKVINRNEIITEKETVIDVQDGQISQQKNQISSLNTNIDQMESTLQKKENEISNVNKLLEKQMDALKQSYKKQKVSQTAYKNRLKKMRLDAESKLAQLENEKNSVAKNLNAMQANLQNLNGKLQQTESQLAQTASALQQKGSEVAGLSDQLKRAGAEAESKMNSLKNAFNQEQARARAEFEGELGRQKNLSQAQIAAKEAGFKAANEAKERKLAGEMASLAGQLKDAEGQLAVANAELEARKNIAKEISQGFRAAGVKADIDMQTGDVVLNFGETYFDNDSSKLKNAMKSTLQKAMPTYAKSLFGNPKIASQISAVEVIGFASPTYAGKIVDPYSTKSQDREALKYNMDLSYQRAKSIFNYILDEREMSFSHRNSLVPALKVSGRSFLDLMKVDRNIASVQEYCTKYDCKKSQRVIIKFNMNKK
jgi:myosin heavy subunit